MEILRRRFTELNGESRKAQEVQSVGSRSNGRDLLRDREVQFLRAVGLKSNGSRGSRVLNGAGASGEDTNRTIAIQRLRLTAVERVREGAVSWLDQVSWLEPESDSDPRNSGLDLGIKFELKP